MGIKRLHGRIKMDDGDYLYEVAIKAYSRITIVKVGSLDTIDTWFLWVSLISVSIRERHLSGLHFFDLTSFLMNKSLIISGSWLVRPFGRSQNFALIYNSRSTLCCQQNERNLNPPFCSLIPLLLANIDFPSSSPFTRRRFGANL